MPMSKRCLRISKSGKRAISKNCRTIGFYTLEPLNPKDDYERLYSENKVVENLVVTLNCIYQMNPSEKMFLDSQLNPQGDALIIGMTHELEENELIGSETDDYLHIPDKLSGCHVRVDNLKYFIKQITLTSFLEGYPLTYSMSLSFDDREGIVADTAVLYGNEP